MTETEAIRNLFLYSWPSDAQLVDYAEKGHGFGGEDGYYGVIYPNDLDEFDKANGETIQQGYLEIYYWNDPDSYIHVTEEQYLTELAGYLRTKKLLDLAVRAERLITSLSH
jgi:hypothetical protein